MHAADEFETIRCYLKNAVTERNAGAPELRPSRYWTDFAKNFRYVPDLPDYELRRIRFHTYHVTSDLYLTYYFASNDYVDLLKRGYEFFYASGRLPALDEGTNGIGVSTNYGRISHDLLRYMGALNDVVEAELLKSHSQQCVLEIGGGYGGLARMHLACNPSIAYVICDLEETMFFSAVYLMNFLGPSKIHMVDAALNSKSLCPGHVYFVPQSRISLLNALRFDYVINQQSFQEMTQAQVERYAKWAAKRANHLYSCNIVDHGRVADEKALVRDLPALLRGCFGEPAWQGREPASNERYGDNHLERAVYSL